jgi:hypothetical protein
MVTLTFTARCPYTICPYKWTYRLSLGFILNWRDPLEVAKIALKRGGYSFDYHGIGPSKHAGQLRFWRWQWSEKSGCKGKERAFHFPEYDYLATLGALLRLNGEESLAQSVEQLATEPLPEVRLLPIPDPYDLSNYTFSREFTGDARQCIRLILDQRDFALANARAEAREGFSVADGSRLDYGDDGMLLLTLQKGRTQLVPEELYLHMLKSAQEAVEIWQNGHENAKTAP